MKKRSVLAVVIFSIITLGIYDLFWLVDVKKELNAKTKHHVPTMWLLFAPLLLIAIGLAVLVATSSSGGNGGKPIIGLVIYILALVSAIPISFYWFFKFSKAVNEYTSGELSTAITFILLWLLRFIGLAVIQDKFNDMIDSDASPTPPGQGTSNGPVAPQQQTPTYQSPQPPVGPIAPEQPVTTNQTPPAARLNPQEGSSEQVPQPPQPPVSPTIG